MFNAPRGMTFARVTLAKSATANDRDALAFASTRWGANSAPAMELRAAVAGGSTDDADYSALAGAGSEASAEFFDIVAQLDLIGRLGPRRVPAGVPVVVGATGATAYWVGGGKSVPLSRAAFDRASMFAKKCAALTVVSNELLRSTDPQAEAVFLRDLVRAAVTLSDATFIDPAGTGSDSTPAAVTAASVPITSTGDLADDAEAALAAFTGSLLSASWVCHPRTAAQAGIRAGVGGAGADMGARGGTLAGLPVVTSEGVPFDSNGGLLVLLDPANIALVDHGFAVMRSTAAMVEMADDPTGATDTPVAASNSMVSLFQTESTGLLLVRAINWQAASSANVVVIEGANYGVAA